MTAEAAIAAISDGGDNTALVVRSALTAVLQSFRGASLKRTDDYTTGTAPGTLVTRPLLASTDDTFSAAFKTPDASTVLAAEDYSPRFSIERLGKLPA